MSWLLNLVYLVLLVIMLPRLAWQAWRDDKHWHGWQAKLFGLVVPRLDARPCIWLHAVSLGEVNLLGTIIHQLQRQRPDVAFYITTTTRTGFETASRRYGQHLVSYCPLDFSWAVRTAMRRIRPSMLVLAELEIWPNMISIVHQTHVPVVVINGRLSERSFRGYGRVRPFFRTILRRLDLIAVQTPTYQQRFLALGADPRRVAVCGSLKFDGAETDRCNPSTVALKRLARIPDDAVVWLAGSTFPPEEARVLEAFQPLAAESPELRLVLVPRHPERFEDVARMVADTGLPWQRRSSLPAHGTESLDWRILLVDTVGELGSWWGTADIAYVGGSMGSRGGQNMIEPAGYGVAVCFGPHTHNFRDVVQQMLEQQAAIVVNDARQLGEFVRDGVMHPDRAHAMGLRARQLVMRNAGATRRTADLLEGLLPSTAEEVALERRSGRVRRSA
jgi:3-deoxy-D-manno-octulosonic-acid transferase